MFSIVIFKILIYYHFFSGDMEMQNFLASFGGKFFILYTIGNRAYGMQHIYITLSHFDENHVFAYAV